jgi:acyl carrier protein
MFSQLGVRAADDMSVAAGGDAESVLTALSQTPEAERGGALIAHLHEIAAVVLGLDSAEFGDEEALSGLGMDSMMAIEVKHRIGATLRVDISVLDLLQGATVTSLAARTLPLLELGGAGVSADNEPPAETASDGGPADELEALLALVSADELDQLLSELERDPT